jgi:hypothetical protein
MLDQKIHSSLFVIGWMVFVLGTGHLSAQTSAINLPHEVQIDEIDSNQIVMAVNCLCLPMMLLSLSPY